MSIGFSIRRISYTKKAIQELSELKKLNGGSTAKACEVFYGEYGLPEGWLWTDLVRFVEDCDEMLSNWEARSGTFDQLR